MDDAFAAMLFLTALTGLALLALRETPAMGVLLALHLGVVFAFFVTMPYGKFVHGIHRFAALLRAAARAPRGVGRNQSARAGRHHRPGQDAAVTGARLEEGAEPV